MGSVDKLHSRAINSMHFADSFASALSPVVAAIGPSPSFQWGIVLFMAILGLLVTLTPPRRTYEVKKPKEE
jgi:hypothetical protein